MFFTLLYLQATWKIAALKYSQLTHAFACLSVFYFFKFWDYRQPRKYLNILPCQVPVWKARYTVSEKLKCTKGH